MNPLEKMLANKGKINKPATSGGVAGAPSSFSTNDQTKEPSAAPAEGFKLTPVEKKPMDGKTQALMALQSAINKDANKHAIQTIAQALNPKTALSALARMSHKKLEQAAIKEDAAAKPEIKLPEAVETVETKPIVLEVKTDAPAVPQIIPSQYQGDIELDKWQQAAIKGLRNQQFGCLIGAAGTGKTTVTKMLVEMLEDTTPQIDINLGRIAVEEDSKPNYNVAIAFCSFTGRAVQQMKRALPAKYHPMCSTVHALLGYVPEFYEDYNDKNEIVQKMRFVPTFNEYKKLPWRVIVIDEASMKPIDLWNKLWAACRPDTRIIMIGDINQLPPVQGRSVLGFAMTKWPTFELKEIWRQKVRKEDGSYISAEANPITEAAWSVLKGHHPKRVNQRFDMFPIDAGSTKAFNNVITVLANLHKAGMFDPLTDGLITAQNVGPLGKDVLNERLVSFFNPPQYVGEKLINRPIIIKTGMETVVFRLGDKLMLLQNDRERDLTNGMTGIISDIKPNGGYDGKRTDVDFRQLRHNGPKELDADELLGHIDIGNEEVSGSGDGKKEEEIGASQRQASHIVTVRFGHISQELLNQKGEIETKLSKLKQQSMELSYDDITMTGKAHLHPVIQEIRGLEHDLRDIEKEIARTNQEISFSTAGQYKKIALAYAFTCHKSQGGEYPTVVIVCHSTNIRMLTREWLYTAITRARSRCILLYNERGLGQSLKVQRIVGKTTEEKIQSFVRLQEEIGKKNKEVIVPVLPERKELNQFELQEIDRDLEQEAREERY